MRRAGIDEHIIVALHVKNEEEKKMDEEEDTESDKQNPTNTDSNDPAAEPKNTEHMIPKSRFDEVNNALKDMRAEFDSMKAANQAAETTRLEAQQEWKTLAERNAAEVERLKAVEEKLTGVNSTLDAILEAQMADLTDDAKAMVPKEYTAQQKLDWIAENRSRLTKPTAPNFDAGARGDSTKTTRQLTSGEQKAARAANMSDPEYLEAALSMERASAQAANVSFKERPKEE